MMLLPHHPNILHCPVFRGRSSILIPDIDFNDPVYIEITDLSGFENCKSLTRLFYIVFSDYLMTPLEMKQIQKNGQLKYYISQRNGGPTIDYLRSAIYEKNDTVYVSSGMLGYHQTFWDHTKRMNVKRPNSLVTHFNQMKSYIRKHSVMKFSNERKFFIGNELHFSLSQDMYRLGGVFEESIG